MQHSDKPRMRATGSYGQGTLSEQYAIEQFHFLTI